MGGRWLKTGGRWLKMGGRWLKWVVSGENGW